MIDEILKDPPFALSFSPPPEGRCVNYDTCGNIAPGPNSMCTECLDRVREKGRGHNVAS